jgi:protein involved in polysaccharide export with SLBB domain
VADLVLKAGGFKESATASRIEIARRVKDDISGKLAEIIIVDIDKELRLLGENAKLELNPFDHVMVRRSPGFQRAQLVNVEGEAMYPGEFALAHANERISDLLKRAGGLTPYAYPKGATLIRRNEFFENKTDDEIKLENLEQIREVINKDSIDWTASERVLMGSIDKKLLEKVVLEERNKLVSDIRKESLMALAESDETIKDLKIKDVELIGLDLPGILTNPYGPLDLILKEGDVLSIPKELQTVRMRGEVLFPTTARYDLTNRFSSYISKSGGFTDNARKSRSYVVYANGDVKRTNKFIFFNVYPKIEPGSEIIIPSKPEREGMSAQSWIGIATSLATIGILLNTLINSNN